MASDVPANFGQQPLYSHVVQAEAEALKALNGVQGVGQDWAQHRVRDAQRQRAGEVAGRLAVEQTTQRF